MTTKFSLIAIMVLVSSTCFGQEKNHNFPANNPGVPIVTESIDDELWNAISKQPMIAYPRMARMAGCQGIVEVHLTVDPTGKVVESKVSDPPESRTGPLFATAAYWAKSLVFPPLGTSSRIHTRYKLFLAFKLPNSIAAQPSPERMFKLTTKQ